MLGFEVWKALRQSESHLERRSRVTSLHHQSTLPTLRFDTSTQKVLTSQRSARPSAPTGRRSAPPRSRTPPRARRG